MDWWEVERHDPKGSSLRLLPSGPDRVGEAFARTVPSSVSHIYGLMARALIVLTLGIFCFDLIDKEAT
jgi:hypothetical protein